MDIECLGCGVCCKLFVINLTKEEYNSNKYKTQFQSFGIVKDFVEAEMIGANIIEQNEDESCIYLKNSKCSIHEKRPKSCQNFFCSSKDEKFQDMIEQIHERKKL